MKIVTLTIIGLLFLLGCKEKPESFTTVADPRTPIQLENVTGKRMSAVKINVPRENDEFAGVDWTFSRKFSTQDVAVAQLAVTFMENITGIKYNVDYKNMYWSDDMLTSMGTNNSLLGMTVFHQYREPWRAFIAITTSLKPPSIHDLNAMRDFGSTVIHECLHASNLDVEHTVRAKIERPIDMSFDLYCQLTVSNFYSFHLDRFTNKPYSKMIEKVAYESGINPPWHYNRDYMGDPIRPIVKLFMVPEGTNGFPFRFSTNNFIGVTNTPTTRTNN
jgi:hypothetical protein